MIEGFEHKWWGPNLLLAMLDDFDWSTPVSASDNWEKQLVPGFIGMCIFMSNYARDPLFMSQWGPLMTIFEGVNDGMAPESINAIWRKWVADVWMLSDIVAKRKQGYLVRRDFDVARSVIQNEAIIAAIEDHLGFCGGVDEG